MRKKYYVESGAIQSILLSEDLDVAAIDFLVGVFDETIKGVDPEDRLSILIFVSEAGFSQDVLKDGTKEQWEGAEFFRTSQILSKIDPSCSLIKDFEDMEKEFCKGHIKHSMDLLSIPEEDRVEHMGDVMKLMSGSMNSKLSE